MWLYLCPSVKHCSPAAVLYDSYQFETWLADQNSTDGSVEAFFELLVELDQSASGAAVAAYVDGWK